MRYLGVYPSENAMVESVLVDMQEEEMTAFIMYDKFEKKVLELMATQEFAPSPDNELLRAFQVIDKERKGYVEAEHMKDLLLSRGTTFREKELESFMSVAKDVATGLIYYEDYVALLTEEAESVRPALAGAPSRGSVPPSHAHPSPQISAELMQEDDE